MSEFGWGNEFELILPVKAVDKCQNLQFNLGLELTKFIYIGSR